MITGIPYFGENHNEIYDSIINSECTSSKKKYNTLYDLIDDLAYRHVVVIIENKWVTWLRDIVFNYRDKECYLPYYEYEIYITESKLHRSNNSGHLILNDDGSLSIRYNYIYKKCSIDVNNLSLLVYDVDTSEKYEVTAENWFDEQFSIDEIYKRYVDSAYLDDEFRLNKHLGGYHYIYRSPLKFRNRERALREKFNLNHYSIDSEYEDDYRDVRNFKYEEVVHLEGLRDNIDCYEFRRLKFESMLYCALRQHARPTEKQFIALWDKLENGKNYIKYGNNIKLIIKNYWLDNSKPIKDKKSWSRV